MHTLAHDSLHSVTAHPVDVSVVPDAGIRNRLTTAFRPILAIPHLLIVGGPIAVAAGWSWRTESSGTHEWGASGGALGAVACVAAMIAWFAILFTGRHPDGLWNLAAFYLRWRVRATAYITLLRDEYPPFGDAAYPASIAIRPPTEPRDRLSVALRLLLIIPHLIVLCALSIAWGFVTIFAWFAILFTGRYPASVAPFSVGVFRWNVRVEAYMLLLHDEYPPFRLHT
jgi:Domain of unknown function (DUF4389)